MSDPPDRSSQTQEPTPKKLKDARKKGDLPTSRETGNMMVVLSLSILAGIVLPYTTAQLAGTLAGTLSSSGLYLVGTNEAGLAQLSQIVSEFAQGLWQFLGPVFGVLLIAAICGVLIQGETVIAFERIKPKLSKISPAQGIKRLFSKNTLVEFLKNMTKVIVVGTIAISMTYAAVSKMWQGFGFYPEGLPSLIAGLAQNLLLAVSLFLVPIAIVDMLWQRYNWKQKQMMTVKEVRDEFKNSEGDPLIKGKRAAIRRERAQLRLVHVIPKASVVITNPTHYAVALKYDRAVDVAPICVAKGADAMALRIRHLAHDSQVPLIENRVLARTLYASADIDAVVPIEHWKAVAEIIGFVEGLKVNRRRKPPSGSVLRLDPTD